MQGINAEIARQTVLVEAGEAVTQETLHFDPVSGRISSLRSKEEAHDYRYFPEPDLVPLVPTPEMLETARAAIGELPAERSARYETDFGLAADTAHLFAFEPEWGDYFESVPGEPRAVANWVTELRSRAGVDAVPAASLASLVELATSRSITAGAARTVLDKMVETGDEPAAIVEREGLAAMDDSGELEAIVTKVIADHPDVVERIRGGNAKAMGALVGPIMRETKGRADGGEVNRLLRDLIQQSS
jgi:aspartyl-tRNA(Asn)/glutamyl-tRNA(Gln) amidotransferase subunit B